MQGHLQGYIDNYEKFKEKGIDEMVVISGNDPYVMQAWADQLNVAGKFRFLADTHGKFCKMSGLVLDEREKFGTLRCKRSCMYVDDALVERLCIEPDGKSVTCSKAEACLEKCCWFFNCFWSEYNFSLTLRFVLMIAV